MPCDHALYAIDMLGQSDGLSMSLMPTPGLDDKGRDDKERIDDRTEREEGGNHHWCCPHHTQQ